MTQLLKTPTPKLISQLEEKTSIWPNLSVASLVSQLLNFFIGLVGAALVVWLGFKLVNFLARFTKGALERRHVSPTLVPFLVTLIGLGGKLVVLLAAASIMGINSASLAALLGASSLAIGLAMQGALANFAGGMLILFLKPFKVGDYIKIEESQAAEGKVKSIQIFYTHLATIDNKTIIIPNGNIMKSTIINYTKENKRRLEVSLKLDSKTDLVKAKETAFELVKKTQTILDEPEPGVYITEIDETGITLSIRAWVKRPDLFKTKTRLLETIKTEFDHHGIELAKGLRAGGF